jgi:allophanate hydrolase
MSWSRDTGSLDFRTLHEAYRAGTLTPTAVVEAVYGRIDARGPDPAWTSLVPRETALATAAALEASGKGPDDLPLYGLPFAIKDSFDVEGYPTSNGCKADERIATSTDDNVRLLIEAGAIAIGKNNMDQFGMGLVGVRTDYGIPSCVFNSDYISGGSTSGGGVVVAAGLVSFALGGDAAGSGRVPAALNNLVGLKPTNGLIPLGDSPAGMTASHTVLTLTVEDNVAAIRTLIRHDRDDPGSLPEAEKFALAVEPMPKTFRFAVPSRESRIFAGDAEAEALFDAAIARLETMGGTAVPFDYAPFHAAARMLYEDAFIARRYANLEETYQRCGDRFHPATREILTSALKYSAADLFVAEHKMARYRKLAMALFEDVDVMVTPTTPTTFTIAELAEKNIERNAIMGSYTNFVNLMGFCALAVPNGFRPDGLPQGLMFIAPSFEDNLLLGFGAAYHEALGLAMGATGHKLPPRATGTGPAVAPGEVEIAVVGAHLSGMPLNGELTSRNARFLRAVPTRRDYRLYALAGGPPQRPGLMRVGEGEGAAIETEVWAVPLDAFGSFVAGIPAPLGIGTTYLADGTAPKGFIVEPAGIKDAEDISRFGGWRAYLARASA